jgi:phosphoglucosamine mutase
MNPKLFGTDGIRSRAGDFPLNAPAIVAIGQAIVEKLRGKLLVGYDTRISSPWILGLLKEGIQRTSAVIDDAGIIPTPAIALLVKMEGYSGGIMISASHNPFEDNGIKVFSADGTKLSDAAEIEIEKRVFQLLSAGPPDIERVRDEIPEAQITAANSTGFPERYLKCLESHFSHGQWLNGLRIVVDCANGAMSQVAPALLERLGASLNVIHANPSGKNINAGCGAVHLESLTEAVNRGTCDFGVAFDGDGDRSLFVSGSGRRIDGDAVLLLMARRMRPAAVVGTSMTNYALEVLLKTEGISLARVDVGDRYIFEEMKRSSNGGGHSVGDGAGDSASDGGMLGGEPSGHIIFPDFGLSGDGLLTALKVAQAVVEAKVSLDELCRDWIPAPHLLKGVRVEKKIPLDQLPLVQKKIAEIDVELMGRGRLVVRYSGTEPLLRVMIESDDATRNEIFMEELIAAIQKSI